MGTARLQEMLSRGTLVLMCAAIAGASLAGRMSNTDLPCRVKSCCNRQSAFEKCPTLGESGTGAPTLELVKSTTKCADQETSSLPNPTCSGGSGNLTCSISQAACVGKGGWTTSTALCEQEFGKPISCPDNLSSKTPAPGVAIFSHEGWNCYSWSSKSAAKGYGTCQTKPDGLKICTKLAVLRAARTSFESGILAMKRLVCGQGRCKVYKAGRCIKIAGKTFYHGGSAFYDTGTIEERQGFAVAAQSALKSGLTGANNCSLADASRSQDAIMMF